MIGDPWGQNQPVDPAPDTHSDPDLAAELRRLALDQPWDDSVVDAAGRIGLAALHLRLAVHQALSRIGAAPVTAEDTLGAAIRRLRIYTIAELPSGGLQANLVEWCDGLGARAHTAMTRAMAGAATGEASSPGWASQTVTSAAPPTAAPDMLAAAGLLLNASAGLAALRVGRPYRT